MPLTNIAPFPAALRSHSGVPAESGERIEKAAADELATAFLAEMLSFAGLNDAISARSGFGGEAMSGFLLQEYAEKIVDRGGFGLSAMILSNLETAEGADVE